MGKREEVIDNFPLHIIVKICFKKKKERFFLTTILRSLCIPKETKFSQNFFPHQNYRSPQLFVILYLENNKEDFVVY